MKAIYSSKYGPPEVLEVREVEKPVAEGTQVLVKVHASAVNDYDWSMVRGKPGVYRLFFGLFKPTRPVPGMELSGTIEAVGKDVSLFEVGDAVYGDTSSYGFGSFAEYMCIDEKALVKKPESMSFEEAASLSHASMLAVQGLIDQGNIQKGQKILINGGGGGVGTFALQIAKTYDCEVTGVDTGPKLNMMRELGFDHVLDYRRENFTRLRKTYDLILDCKSTRGPFAYLRALNPNGKYVTIGGYILPLLRILLQKGLIHLFTKKRLSILGLQANKDLDYIHELYKAEKLKCTIDGPYPLEKTPEAIRYFGEGKHAGKVIIKIQ